MKKKQGPGKVRLVPSFIIEFILKERTTGDEPRNPDEMNPVNKVIYWKKTLVPDCNKLAYRKGNKEKYCLSFSENVCGHNILHYLHMSETFSIS